ncbi:hypothetical protein [Collinsella bouchesdurhonensis]|uniref:hypothetical protein n=1 Tax=Collinsella bouchesdurhonensis TaxID=1907654 RepID=UPI0035651E8A
MGSKKRSAREKQKMAFLADLGNENMGAYPTVSLPPRTNAATACMPSMKKPYATNPASARRATTAGSKPKTPLLPAPPMDAAALLATNAPGAEVGTSRLIRSDNAGAAERRHL